MDISNHQNRPRICIVDDDEAVRDSLRTLLEAFDFEVSEFASAKDFLEAADANGEGCLLLDLHMPGMSGIDLLAHMQAHGMRYRTIIITGRSDSLLRDKALKHGALELIDKPVRDDVLLRAISRALAPG